MIVILQKRLNGSGALIARVPIRDQGPGSQKMSQDKAMKDVLRTAAAAAAALVAAIALGAMLAPNEATAGEYCRRDVTGHMTGCSFGSMEQCQAMRYGLGGDCFRDPFLGYNRSIGNPGNASNAYAYQPRLPPSGHHAR